MSKGTTCSLPSDDAKLPAAARKDSSHGSSDLISNLGRKFSHDGSLPLDDLPDCTSIARDDTQLESLTVAAKPADDNDNETFASSGHRLLMEAIMIKTVDQRDRLDSFVHQRQRLESWGAMSELSFTGVNSSALDASTDDMIPTRIQTRDRLESFNRERLDSLASCDGGEQRELQACVAAAVASFNDELGELQDLAGRLEHVVADTDDFFQPSEPELLTSIGRPRTHSVSSAGKLSVDLEAVQAAVDAGEAASQTLGLKDLPEYQKPVFAKRTLPLARDRTGSQTSNDSKGSIPLKKRAKRPSVAPSSIDPFKTPKVSNKRKRDQAPESVPSSTAKGEDRWETMYTCLLEFAASKRHEMTKDMSDVESNAYVWDGNVPTSYSTKDGNKLGRWVNNQRTAKQKGKLRPDREEKLIAAGLKWFIIPPDAWDDMFEELKLYIASKQKDGAVWDGHVPTNYQTTGKTWKSIGKDKNLGRWVNRQRDMFQNGKLKPARKEKLERLGLKWPKNAVTWDEMLNLYKEYGARQRKTTGTWDGTVPSCYQTNSEPPRLLGKWVARQKMARIKKKLTKVQEDKLTAIGMEWDDNDGTDTKPAAVPIISECQPMEVISIPMSAVAEI